MRSIFLLLFTIASFLSFGSNGRMLIVAVGIADYSEIPDLKFGDKDAAKVASLFQYSKLSHKVVLLRNNEATKNSILSQLSDLFSHANEEDIVLFYFSGHGGKGFFCPYDASNQTLLTYNDIRQVFVSCKAKRQLLIADACNSGAIRISLPENKQTNPNPTGKELVFFLSSRSSQFSAEMPEIEGGVFTYFLLQGLKGGADNNRDRLVTAKELFDFVAPKVKDGTLGRQIPVMWGNFSDQMVIFDWTKN